MATRLDAQSVRGGKLDNISANKVRGWLEMHDGDSIVLDLAGNLPSPWNGQRIVFSAADRCETLPTDLGVSHLADTQIGALGRLRVDATDDAERTAGFRFYLEWFSQDGIVSVELASPKAAVGTRIGYLNFDASWPDIPISRRISARTDNTAKPDDSPQNPLPDTGPRTTDRPTPAAKVSGTTEWPEADLPKEELQDQEPMDLVEEDPNLEFPQAQLEAELFEREWKKLDSRWQLEPSADENDAARTAYPSGLNRPSESQPLTGLFDPPIALPPADKVRDNRQAEALVLLILARLALHRVAVEICEHCSPLTTYKILLENILPQGSAHETEATRAAGRREAIQRYTTSVFCPICAAGKHPES